MKINLVFTIRIEFPDNPDHKRQIKQLISSIDSIPEFGFENSIFCIERNSFTKKELSVVESKLKTKTIRYFKSNIRPSNRNEWFNLYELIKLKFQNSLSTPILFMLNHDHAFVTKRFEKLRVSSNKFLKRYPNSFYYYSLMPELVSYIYNPPSGFQYKWDNDFFLDTVKLRWLDCHFITNLNGFQNLLNAIKEWPEYAPRLDWTGIVFKPFEAKVGFSLIEWCFHQDGFKHFLQTTYHYPDGLENSNRYHREDIFIHTMIIDLICLNIKLKSFFGEGIIKSKLFKHYFYKRKKFYEKTIGLNSESLYKSYISSRYIDIIERSSHKTLKGLRFFWGVTPSFIRSLYKKVRKLI